MRHIASRLTLLAAVLMISAVPVLADEYGMDKTMRSGEQIEKNECLLVAKDCGNQVDTIQERIERIRGEISRGTDVYTKDELRKLNRELDEAIKLLNNETVGG